jgi:AraC-like DNA-binding protein
MHDLLIPAPMIKQIHQLPEGFFNGQLGDTNLYIYHTSTSSQHNKVSFSRNLICFLQEGRKEVASGARHLSFNSDQVLLLRAGNTLMTEQVSDQDSFRSILLFFSDDFLLDFMSENMLGMTHTKSPGQTMMTFRKDEYLLNFEQSLLLLEKGAVGNDHLLRSKSGEILLYLFERESEQMLSFARCVLGDHRHIPFRRIIESQQDLNLGIEELAFLCHMSVSTFKRKFAEVFHTTPKKYFIDQKMHKALLLLQQNKRPSDICFELGYETLSAFSSEFKKHFGASPRAYTKPGLLK